jgi:hypothetical protein
MSQRDKISTKDKIEAAHMLEWMVRADDVRYLEHHKASIELIQYNFDRGMSRSMMNRIWGRRLVDAVVGPEGITFIKQEETNERTKPKPRTR